MTCTEFYADSDSDEEDDPVRFAFVRGYDKKYIIGSDGNVTSLKRKQPKVLTGVPNTKGYLKVNLYHNGKKKTTDIHKLVANHFIPNPDNKPEIDHRDVNQLNNDVHNLRWVTSAENNQNRGMYSNNTTGVTGVYPRPNNTFKAEIKAYGHNYTKTFKTKPEAAAWRAKMKAAFHFGE